MTKNKLLLNQKGRNHIKYLPMEGENFPEDEAEQIKYVENVFNELINAKTESYYKNIKKGYIIAVWSLNEQYYLSQCIRDENKMYNMTIYHMNVLEDAKSIAKFLRENIETIMNDYKDQVDDFKKEMLKRDAGKLPC